MNQTEVQTKTKDGICDILQVTKSNLRMIESRGKLEERLEHKGYKLISKEKKGRSYVYNIQEINSSKKPIQTYVIMYFIPIYMRNLLNIICIGC